MDVRLALSGFGNVGQGLAQLLGTHREDYLRRYGVNLLLTGVADRRGAVADVRGLDPVTLLEAKRADGTVASAPGGQAGLEGDDFLAQTDAHLLVEAASTNFEDAEPGWSYCRFALSRHMDLVLASKGALALYYRQLMYEAEAQGRRVLFSGTTGAPLPVLEIADRVLLGTTILGVDSVVNGTANQILFAMGNGATYDEGVKSAQDMGIAETDPTLDVDGWDAAAKAVIIANAVLGADLTLADVVRTGIRDVTIEQQREAQHSGKRIKLISRVAVTNGEIKAEVLPEARPLTDPLGALQSAEMGALFHTNGLGDLAVSHVDAGGVGGGVLTAMTVLRDIFNLARERNWGA